MNDEFSKFHDFNHEKSQNKKKPHGLTGRKRPFEVRKKISDSHKGKKKNYTSWLKGRTGPDHPSYKHGQGKKRIPSGEQELYNAWVQGVYQTWNFCCALTGISVGSFHAHHLNGWDNFPEERYHIENGVLLSESVHKNFHQIYGNGNNTCFQFDEFVEMNYKNVDCEWNNRKIKENHQPNLNLADLIEKRKTHKQKSFDQFLELVQNQNHQFLSGNYENVHSEIWMYCPRHDCSHATTFHNYKRSKTGLPCCGKERQSDASSSYIRDPRTGRFRDFTSNNQKDL